MLVAWRGLDRSAPLGDDSVLWPTTPAFLELWGLPSLRDLPDLARLEDAGLLGKPPLPEELRGALGSRDDDYLQPLLAGVVIRCRVLK
jgi:hypothetical protein